MGVRRKHIQKDFARLYHEHTDTMKMGLYEEEGPEIREDFSTEVSNWYFNYRVKFKQWPEEVQDYLDPEKNGQNMPEVLPDEDDGEKKKEKKKKGKKGKAKDDPNEFEESPS